MEMDVEVDKNAHFTLVLLNGGVLVFDANLLKYTRVFTDLYKDGFRSYHEHKDFSLSYGVWRLILSFLAEYDNSGESEPRKNSWARVIASLDLLQLYDIVRIMDYYDVVVAMRAVLSIIMPRLMAMPRPLLREYHSLAIFKPESEMLREMRHPFDRINKQYSFRREDILAVCVAYIRTHEIVQLINRAFLPYTTSLAGINNREQSMLLITSNGVKALGDNSYGQLGTGIENKEWAEYDEHGELDLGDAMASLTGGRFLVAWGEWAEERLAKPDWLSVPLPAHAEIISVASVNEHTLFLTTDGLYGAGSNNFKQLGITSEAQKREAVLIEYVRDETFKQELYFLPIRLDITNVLLIACGWSHSMIYTTQGLYACGYDSVGQTGLVTKELNVETFTRILFDEEVAALALDGNVSFVLTKAGKVYQAGVLEEESYDSSRAPLHELLLETRIVSISTWSDHALFLDEHGDVYYKDWITSQELPGPRKIIGLPPIVSIFTPNEEISFFIDASGIVYASDHSLTTTVDITCIEQISIVPIPHKVVSIIETKSLYYFLTCDGLYKSFSVFQKGDDDPIVFEKVDLQISDVPICNRNGSSIERRTTTFSGATTLSCHYCGEKSHTLLGYHKETQHIFCHTRNCLSQYKEFRAPITAAAAK